MQKLGGKKQTAAGKNGDGAVCRNCSFSIHLHNLPTISSSIHLSILGATNSEECGLWTHPA